MRPTRWLVPSLTAAILGLAACGGGAAPASTAPASSPAPASVAASAAASAKPAASAAASASAAAKPAASGAASGAASAKPAASGAASAAASGAAGAKPTVTIGSTNFSEQLVLGELYAQVLESNGYKVNRQFNLGTREIVQPALESGKIDMDAEYLATLLVFVDKNAKASTDPAETSKALQAALTPKKLTVLQYAPAVDTNGFAVTKATADKSNLKKLSDLAPVASQMVLGGAPECPQRPFCLPGLQQTYGLKFKDFKPLDTGGPITVQALDSNQVQVGELFTTDAQITAHNFVLLDDDKHLQLSDNVAPVIRTDVLTQAPEIKTLIDAIAPKLTTAELTGLNKQVGVDKKEPKDVAAAWLKANGLVK
ncbi:MAG: glycine betaine ABC transporter substrate-binding protein [Chloroflexota bacterium]